MILGRVRSAIAARFAPPVVRPVRRPPGLESLEPRLLFSGDPAGAALAEVAAAAAETAADSTAHASAQLAAAHEAARADAPADAALAAASHELVVVDTRAPDLAATLAELQAQRDAGRDLTVLRVDATTDGLSAITAALAATDGAAPFDAVHLIGHGEAGAMRLGSATLDLDALRARAGELAGWSSGLSTDADLLLWGCDVAADADGRAMLDGLSALTGADVAASTDATGGLRAGGDWTLEARVGAIEAAAPIGAALQAGYDGLLALAPSGGEVQVNAATAGDQRLSPNGGGQAATSASGVTVVVWRDADAARLMASRFDATGTAVGAPIVVSAAANARDPAVAVDAAGNFVVAWTRSGGNGVIAQRFDASGAAIGGTINVDPGADDSSEVAVAMNASGRFVVAWTEEDDADTEVRARAFDASGGAVTGVLDVGGPLPLDQGAAAVAIRDDGRFAVAFQSAELLGFGEGVYLRRYDADGTSLSPFVPVPVHPALGDQVTPDVAVDAAGDYVVAWADLGATTPGIHVQRYAAGDGSAVGARIRVDVAGAGTRTEPSVAAMPGGGFVVGWQSSGQDGSGAGLYGRAFLADGTPDSGEVAVNATTAGDQAIVSVAAGAGRAMFAWSGASALDGQGVVLRPFVTGTPGVTLVPTVAVVGESGSPAGTLSVVLDAVPGAPVVVTLSVDDPAAATLSTTTLTFTAADWNVAQTVSVLGVDDGAAAGDRPVTVQAGTASADAAFVGLTDAAGFTVVDDEGPPGVVLTAGGTTLTEAGTAQTVTVVLASPPAQRVTVELAVTDAREGRLSTTTLAFMPGDWNVAQTVVLTGVDDTVIDGTRTFSVTALADSIAPDYSGVAATPLVFTNADDDVRNRVVVDTAADAVDGDTSSLATLWHDRGADGLVSLREALLAAGATPNGPAGADVIAFDLPGAGARTIALGAALPTIADPVVIDATTDPEYAGAPVVVLTAASGSYDGLVLAAGSEASTVRGLAIGGMAGAGLRIGASDVLVESNHLGLDAAGTGALGNGGDGVRIEAGSGQVVRDNVIGANGGHGVAVVGADAVQVADNLIGVARDRVTARGNGGDGVRLAAGAADALVLRNVIAANGGAGVWIGDAGSDRNTVAGNAIGTDLSGVAVLGNAGGGVVVRDGASSNRIGGVGASDPNLIRHNAGAGVRIADAGGASRDNAILGNRIDGNGLGIDLSDAPGAPAAVTPNDAGDGDAGGNGLFNFPVLASAGLSADGATLTLAGTVSGAPGERIRIEVFADPTPDPSGHGQGPVWIGTFDVVADGGGEASFVRAFAVAGLVASGHAVSATATRANPSGTAWYDTSEFSAAALVAQAPAIVAPLAFTVPEGATGPFALQAADADTPAASLAWSIVGGADAAAFDVDAATGTLGLRVAPDHERPADANLDGVYEVEVRVVDPQGLEDRRTVTVSVLDVAESPVAYGPAAVGATEDVPRVLSADDGTALSFVPGDAVAAPFAVELSVDRGTLSLTGTGGLAFAPGDGPQGATLRFTGSAADVGAAIARIVFTPPADATGAAVLRFTVAEAGDASRAASVQVAITIAPVDDAPVLVAQGPVVVFAGERGPIGTAALQAVDVDDGPADLVFTIEQLPADGVLRRDGVALAAGDRFTQAELDAGRVGFDAPQADGVRTLTLSVADPGGNGPRDVAIEIRVIPGAAAPTPTPVPAPAPAPVPVAGPAPAAGAATGTGQDGPRGDGDGTSPAAPAAGASAGAAPAGPVATAQGDDRAIGRAVRSGATTPAAGATRADAERDAGARRADPVESTSADATAFAFAQPRDLDRSDDARIPPSDPRPVARADAPIVPLPSVAALREAAFREELAQLRESLAERVAFDRTVVASTAALGAGVSIGYVLWMLRGGVLLASLLAALPAWRAIDPLPVLGRLDARGRDDGDEDDSLRGILRDASPGEDPRAASPATAAAATTGPAADVTAASAADGTAASVGDGAAASDAGGASSGGRPS